MEEKIFQQLQFSYDRLQNEKLKQSFLCSALYPEDRKTNANELIELWLAEGLQEEMDNGHAEIDKGHTILNKLKSCCLLVDGRKGSAQMQDLMRDMALRITMVRLRFLVRAGILLNVIPDVQEWDKDLDKLSLMKNRELQIPSQMPPPKCPKLSTLLVSRCNIKSIRCFFEQKQRLKILDLSDNPIESLLDSISNLETLTTLVLHHRYYLEKMPSFSQLQALKKLGLAYTQVKDLPHGMERLVHLKYLDFCEIFAAKVAD